MMTLIMKWSIPEMKNMIKINLPLILIKLNQEYHFTMKIIKALKEIMIKNNPNLPIVGMTLLSEGLKYLKLIKIFIK
jgi:hypothetical protein